ncbi:MAG: IS200/IS605 family transposase [Eubacteriales bacterium]|nr:IS200/IS605 family transposase [Eubacteriales bacterium]
MENYFDIKVENELSYGRGYVYSLQYHIVWCTKYRKQILVGDIEKRLRVLLLWLAEEYHFEIQAMEVMPDHVHLLVKCKPQFYIPDMIKIMKGNTARRLFVEFPEMKAQLWGGHLWNPSYCVVTVSDHSYEQVKHYIDMQKEK